MIVQGSRLFLVATNREESTRIAGCRLGSLIRSFAHPSFPMCRYMIKKKLKIDINIPTKEIKGGTRIINGEEIVTHEITWEISGTIT